MIKTLEEQNHKCFAQCGAFPLTSEALLLVYFD